jgi:hypothetical protein
LTSPVAIHEFNGFIGPSDETYQQFSYVAPNFISKISMFLVFGIME